MHSDVYVSRDLTYAQRTELYRRREARQVQPGPGAGRADGVGAGPSQQVPLAVGATSAQTDDAVGRPQAAPEQPGACCCQRGSRCFWPGKLSSVPESTLIRLSQINLNGLTSKMSILTDFVRGSRLDIVCITESHLLEQ